MFLRAWTTIFLAIACFSLPGVSAVDARFKELLASTRPSSSKEAIPKICHFIYGLQGGSSELAYHHFLAVKAARDVIKPTKIFVWVHYEPHGQWWNEVKRLGVEVKYTDLIDSVGGRAIVHFAHKADLLRLKVLHIYGGIYLDMDVVALKSFDDLLDHSFVMGHEGKDGSIGLCNAVILSQPRAPFLRRWMEAYHNFDGTIWNFHSVSVPGLLSKLAPEEITVLGDQAFFWPLWDPEGLQTMYMQKTYDFANNYAVHLWESNAKDWWLDQMDKELIANIDLPFFCQMRRITGIAASNAKIEDCLAPKRTIHPDGAVSRHKFNSDTYLPRVNDALGNHLHGFAINGTTLVQTQKDSQARHFRGNGDFISLPTLSELNLREFSMQMRISPHLCQSAGSVAAAQTSEFVLLIESTCDHASSQHPSNTLWLKVFPYRGWESPLLEFEMVHNIVIPRDEWTWVTVTASGAANSVKMYANDQVVAQGPWPPSFSGGYPENIKNFWLGARPTSPFPNPYREVENDFVGLMDEFVVWDHAISDARRTAVIQGAYFATHEKLVASPDTFSTAVFSNAREDASKSLELPIVVHDHLPVRTNYWTISAVFKLPQPFLPRVPDDAPYREPSPAPTTLMTVSFGGDEQYMFIGYDSYSARLQIRQYGFGWPATWPAHIHSACPLTAGTGIPIHLSLELDEQGGTVTLYCNSAPILARSIPLLVFRPELAVTTLDKESFQAEQVEISNVRRDASARRKQVDEALQAKVDVAVQVEQHKFNITSAQGRSQPLALPPDTLKQKRFIRLTVGSSFAVDQITPSLQQLNGSSTEAFLPVHPFVQVSSPRQNVFELSTKHLDCNGASSAEVALFIPELFVSFAWSISCSRPSSSRFDRLAMTFSDLNDWQVPAIKESYTLQDLLAHGLLVVTVSLGCLYVAGRYLSDQSNTSISRWRLKPGWLAQFDMSTHYIKLCLVASILATAIVWSQRSGAKHRGSPAPATESFHTNSPVNVTGALATVLPVSGYSTSDRQHVSFSVITPCYLQGDFLNEAAQSLFQQTYPHFDWVIVIDGDETCLPEAQRLKQLYSFATIHIVHKKSNSGLAHSRNVGISVATSPWICLLDADDRLDPTYLEQAASAIKTKPRVTAVNANQQFFGESDWKWNLPKFTPELMMYRGIFPVNTIFRKQDWLRIGGFEPTLPFGNEDWSFWLALSHLDDFELHHIPSYLLFYRYKTHSMQRSKETHKEVFPLMMTLHPDKYTKEELELAHVLIGRYADISTKQLVDQLSARFASRRPSLLWKGIFAEAEGKWQEAMKFYRQSIDADHSGLDWQPAHRLQIVLQKSTNHPPFITM